jgi:hypothetical protein
MIVGLAWMAVAHGALLLATNALLRRVRTGHGAMDALLFLLLHLLLISVTVLGAGLAGGLTPAALGIAGAVLLIALLVMGEHRFLPRPRRPDFGRATMFLAGAIALRMLLTVWFLAPTNGDALSYHLPKIAEWVRAGRFTREMGTDYLASFPAGFELIETWWVVFLRHDVLIEMAGVEFAALAFLAVRLLGTGIGMSERSALLAATLYVLTPLFSLQSTSCLNDAPVAALVLSAAALLVACAHPLLPLLPLALVLGVKATGLFALPGLVVLWLWRRKSPPARPASLRLALALVLLAGVVGAFWYGRNIVWYGNPFHPVKGDPQTYLERINYIQRGPKLTSLRFNADHLFSSFVYDRDAGMTPICKDIAGWGIIAFSIGAIALLSELRRDRAFRIVAAAAVVSLLSVLCMVRCDAWFARFILFFPAIPCLAAARLAESSRPVAVLLGIAAAFQFAGSMLSQEQPAGAFVSIMRRPWRERSAAEMQDMVPPAEPVGVHAVLRVPIYVLYRPDFSRPVTYLRDLPLDQLPEEMNRRGIRTVIIRLLPRTMLNVEDFVRQGKLRKVRDRFYQLP